MGRIAEALKRAQQERAQRLEAGSAQTAVESAEATPSATPARTPSNRFDVLSRSSILRVPSPPKPFPIESDPIEAKAVGPQVVALHDATCEIAERFRSVRTRLLTGNPAGSPRVLAVTSSLTGEGKTVTTANMGFVLAELRYLRVTIIDLDFRRRGLSHLFGVADKPGMAEVFRGEKKLSEVCIPAVRENLYLIPAGEPAAASPTELLTNPSVAGVFKELNERFHYSLVDTHSAHKAADIGLIAPLCHSVLVVVRMGKTPESVVCRCVKSLQANNVPISGCILTGNTNTALASETHDYFQTIA